MKHLLKNQKGFSHHLLLPIFVIVAVTIIGGYVLQKSHAQSIKVGKSVPDAYTLVADSNFTTTDGVKTTTNSNKLLFVGSVYGECFLDILQTPYGQARLCGQWRAISSPPPQFQFRTVIHNISAKKYLPNSGWVNFGTESYYDSSSITVVCRNTGNYFEDFDGTYIDTAFGPLAWGQEYAPSATSKTGWQVNLAARNGLNKNCSQSVWYNIIGTYTTNSTLE